MQCSINTTVFKAILSLKFELTFFCWLFIWFYFLRSNFAFKLVCVLFWFVYWLLCGSFTAIKKAPNNRGNKLFNRFIYGQKKAPNNRG